MTHMTKRILVGAVLIAAAAAVFTADWRLEEAGLPRLTSGAGGPARVLKGLPLAALMVLLIAAGFLELSRLLGKVAMPVLPTVGMASSILVGTLPFWRQALPGASLGDSLMPAVLGIVLMLLFVEQSIRHRTAQAMRHVGASLLAVCYLGVCGAVALSCRLRFGLGGFLLFLMVVKFTDIGAYFTGSFIGRHKIAPWISPGKSWEGLVGGVVLAAAVAAAMVTWADAVFPELGRIGLPAAVVMAVVLGTIGQLADLCESAMKRDAGVKDSGSSLPAFGGVLDVLDSPLLAAPAAYVLFAIFA